MNSRETCKFFNPETGGCRWKKELGRYIAPISIEVTGRNDSEGVQNVIQILSFIPSGVKSGNQCNGCESKKSRWGDFNANVDEQRKCNAYIPFTGGTKERIDAIRRSVLQ